MGLDEVPESLGGLTGLQSLDLSNNQLSALPESLGGLTELQSLNLSQNQLTALPESIGRLTGLKTLVLWSNGLSALPELLGGLTELRRLDLSHNKLTALPESLGRLAGLRILTLSHNQLTALPESLGRLAGLWFLTLSRNQLASLPEWFGGLPGLRSLNLSRNQLTALPEWFGGLTRLQSLDLSQNQLTALPESLGRLANLRKLFLHDNIRLGLPPEVLGPTAQDVIRRSQEPASPSEVLRYYFQIHRGEVRPLGEAKIIIVGQGDVGKTSLVNRLIRDEFDPNEKKTEGIRIEPWSIPTRADREKDSPESIRLNIWDFGGQEIMHATHQFFLTKRSLYLIVLDAETDSRKGDGERIVEYWLKIVQSFGGDSPILVVTNKVEPPHDLDLNETRLRKDYAPILRGFFKVSCATGRGIPTLKEAITQEVHALPHVYDRVPAKYFAVKDELAEMARSRNFIDYSEYRSLCRKHGIERETDWETLIRFLHDLGTVLNFHDPESPYKLQLQDTNILNPEWVTGGVYRIINSVELREAGGILERKRLESILGSRGIYPAKRHDFILGMMRKFELCFDFPGTNGTRLLIPELLSKNEPDLGADEQEALRFEYHYDVMPDGLISRFIVKMHHNLTRKPTYWRYGVVLSIDGNRAVVRADVYHGQIFVSVSGPEQGRRRALSVIRDAFRAIHVTIPKLPVREMVPLPDDPSTVLAYGDLLAFERDGITAHPVRLASGKTKIIDVPSLLGEVVSIQERQNEQEIQRILTSREGPAMHSKPAPDQPTNTPTPPSREAVPAWQVIAAGAIGVVFVATLLAIAIFSPNPTTFQIFVFRVVLSLAAGGLGALIPGFLEVRFRNWLRAGGALALFVLVYSINPPALIAQDGKEAKPEAAKSTDHDR